jgi:hypothetical protein
VILALFLVAPEIASGDPASFSAIWVVIGLLVLVAVALASPALRRSLGRGRRRVAAWFTAFLAGGPPAQDRSGQRQRLIDRKHATMSEVRMLQREIRSLEARGVDVGERHARLRKLQSEHYRLRLEIDRTRPE